MRAFLAFLAVLLVIAGAGAYASAFIVHQNEQAIVLEFGKFKRQIQEPGLNWKIPLIETVEVFDKRILDIDTATQEVTASDRKRLLVDAFARYKIVDPLKFYQTLRQESSVRSRLGPIIESAIRGALGAATFQDLVRDKREALMKQIATNVNEEGRNFGLEVVDVRIKRADLPEQNLKSVFDRMRAERNREANEFRATGSGEANRIRATADREVTVIKAEATRKGEELRGQGDAERNRIFADAFGRDPDFFRFYRSMQAYEASLKSGDTRLVISPDSDFFKFFGTPGGNGPTQAMTDLAVAIGLVLVIEGLLWALAPGAARAMLEAASAQPESSLRKGGWIAVAVGAAIVWFIRG